MATAPRPITTEQFTLAIQDLPLENVYAKAAEIQNSISHLQRSNAQLKEFSDSIRNDASIEGETREEVGDRECLEAIRENEEVIERQRERIALLRQEVERRGQRWHEGGANGEVGDEGEAVVNGTGARAPGGRLTDEELRRRMEEQMRDDEDDEEGGAAQGGGGLHL
jgi:hypothetical protein